MRHIRLPSPDVRAAVVVVVVAGAASLASVWGALAVLVAGAAVIIDLRRASAMARRRAEMLADGFAEICVNLGASGRRPEDAIAAVKQFTRGCHVLSTAGGPLLSNSLLGDALQRCDGQRSASAAAPERLDRMARGLDGMPELCELSASQLDAVVRDSEIGAWSQFECIQKITRTNDQLIESAGRIREQLKAEVAGASRGDNGSMVAKLRDYGSARSAGELAAAADRHVVSAAVKDARSGSIDLNRSATRVSSLAINATIEASRSGSDAPSSRLVAKEFVDLSRSIDAQASLMAEQLERVHDAILDEERKTEARREDDRRTLFLLTQSGEAQADIVARIARIAEDILAEIDRVTGEISNAALSAVGQLQSQDLFRQKIEASTATMKGLSEVATSLHTFASDPRSEEIQAASALAERVSRTYVTLSQRRIHAAASGSSGALEAEPDLPEIELF